LQAKSKKLAAQTTIMQIYAYIGTRFQARPFSNRACIYIDCPNTGSNWSKEELLQLSFWDVNNNLSLRLKWAADRG
jgi:hypothetical protein